MRNEFSFNRMVTEALRNYGTRVWFAGKGFAKTYNDFYRDIRKLSSYLLEIGLGNKRIGIFASNSYEWVLLFFTVIMNVGTIVPLDKELPEKELKTSAKRLGLDCIFYDDSTKDRAVSLSETIRKEKIESIETILKRDISERKTKLERECAALFLTSGTTSQSKIVMLSEKNLVSCAYASAAAFKLKPSDRYYTILPLHHTLTLMCAVLVPMTNGCSICFNKNIKDMKKEMKYYQPTALVVVPRLLEYIMNSIKLTVKKTHKEKMIGRMVGISNAMRAAHIDMRKMLFRSILAEFGGKMRMIACGGAELDPRVFNYLDDLGFNIYQGYGLTETAPILTIRGMFVKSKAGVGRPLRDVRLKIDKPNEMGEGEIVVKAPQVMIGYYHDKKATNEVLRNGWFYTGDLGRIRKDGNLEVVGRKKNVIVASNGKNIYPEELETLINYSDLVRESVVSGMKKGSGIQIVATIVLEDKYKNCPTVDSKIEKLIEEINADLPEYKRINKYVIRQDEFRKTTTMKIKRGSK